MTALVLALALVVAVLGLLVVGLLRSHAEILRQLHALGASLDPDVAAAPAARGRTEPPAGVRDGVVAPAAHTFGPASDLAGVGIDDDLVAVGIVGAPQDTLLAFLSSGCLTCRDFWDAFRSRELGLPAGTRLVIVTKDPDEESVSAVRDLAPQGVTLVMSSQAWTDFGVPGSPYFVQVDGPRGQVIGEGSATTWPQVRKLVQDATGDLEHRRRGGGEDRGGSAHREARADAELAAAGIEPGDPSLFAQPAPQQVVELEAGADAVDEPAEQRS